MQITRNNADELFRTALVQLQTSTDFKRNRLKKIKDAEDMLLGVTKAKTRQQFNVPLPVLSGFFDKLCADLDDPVLVKVRDGKNREIGGVAAINEMIASEKKSLKISSRWDYKDRISRKNAIASGRGFLKIFSSADPYQATLEAPSYAYMHVQPSGGGLLERHLFVGEEGIIRTKNQLIEGAKNGIYDIENVKTLLERAGSKEYQEKMSAMQDDQNRRFRALGLDPDSNNFIGETAFSLVEWVLTKYGERWYLLFDPYTRTWLRFEKLTNIYPSGFYPWKSYATHEDDENFWSTSILADVLYPIADGIVTAFNQEMTNRQKRNLNARFYDKDMIKNIGELDQAQYRADALVGVDTYGGTRKIADGVYQFTTPELTGTIDLISWLTDWTGQQTGIYQNIPVIKGGKNSAINNIVFAEIQQMAKRTDYRSHSYNECWGEVILSYVDGLKKNLTEEEAIERIGPDFGLGFKKQLKEIKLTKDNILIISTKEQTKEDALQKQQKIESLKLLGMDPGINPDWKRRHILSDVGGWEEDDIEDATDMRGLGETKDQLVFAEDSINMLRRGKEPEICWNATTIFQRKILDFERKHHDILKSKGLDINFIQYVRSHNQIVMENMKQLAERLKTLQMAQASQGGQPPQQGTPPQKSPHPTSPQKIPTSQPNGQAGGPTPIGQQQGGMGAPLMAPRTK